MTREVQIDEEKTLIFDEETNDYTFVSISTTQEESVNETMEETDENNENEEYDAINYEEQRGETNDEENEENFVSPMNTPPAIPQRSSSLREE